MSLLSIIQRFPSTIVINSRDFQSSVLRCNCDLKWIVKWEKNNNIRIMENTVCQSPPTLIGHQVHKLKKGDLICGKFFNFFASGC